MATYNQISYGSKGSDVTELQKLLNQNGYKLSEDGIFGKNTQAAVKEYQKANGLSADGVVGKNTWGALTKTSTNTTTGATTDKTGFQYDEYKPSDVVTQAEALLQQQLAQKPGGYTSSWQAQLNEILAKILNRENFSYDLNGDALYQQYKDQYTTQGKMAMMDTMGQAQAMTGGYGNSYAQSVGQQAYQGYLQQLNDRVPELYQLALDQYNREGDEMYDQASIMAQMEEQDYGRYRDALADYYTELDRLAEDARYQGEMDYGKWADSRDFSYGQYVDDRNLAYQKDRDAIADKQWQAQFDEAKRQWEAEMAEQQRQFNKQYNLSASKSSSSSSSSGGSGGNNSNDYYSTPAINYDAKAAELQNALGITVDGKWGSGSMAAAKAKWGVTSLEDAYAAYKKWEPKPPTTNYYTQALNDLKLGKSKGYDNAWANNYLSSMVKEGLITQSAQMTLYNKFRDNRLN